jgi:1-acyl-sn-glycerol-3-phosphate acyltransferase
MDEASDQLEIKLRQLLHDFLLKMGSERAAKRITLTSEFEADLGIDSLGRVEFLHVVEEDLSMRFPLDIFQNAQSIQDLKIYLTGTSPKKERVKVKVIPKEMNVQGVGYPEGDTLVDSLLFYVERDPGRVHIHLHQEDGTEIPITYGHLYESAREVAMGLRALGVETNETVAIMLPTSEEFFYAYFGVILAGGIPVPIYPPFRPNRLEEYVTREAILLRNAGAKILITFKEAEALSKLIQGLIPSLEHVITVPNLLKNKAPLQSRVLVASDPAFIQYTSGSTGNPKGVYLTHGNLLANIRSMGEALHVTPEDRVVSWLPLYHDMGLIGCWLGSLHFGVPATILSPLMFLSRPERWLWAIHEHKGTISAAPNFAYELCIRRIKEESLEGLDLRSWRIAANGAEMVHAHTFRRFAEKFEPFGLRKSTLFPVYGLAENSVGLCFPPLNRSEPRVDLIQREPLETKGVALKAELSGPHTTEFVACGHAIPGHRVKIVDKEGVELPERTIGRLWFQGPSSMQMYYNNPDATLEVMKEGWIDSKDYAYLAEGDVFIVGRMKDMIIKAGRNLYPQDIEDITSSVEGIRKGCVIAFGTEDKTQGTEKLIVVAETTEKEEARKEEIIHKVTMSLSTELGFPPDEVVLVRPGVVPKTSSGKLQRAACKELYLTNKLGKRAVPIWLQVTKIGLASFFTRLTYMGVRVLKLFYTIYVGLVLLVLLVPILSTLFLSSQSGAQRLSKFWLRLIFFLSFCPIKVIHDKAMVEDKPMIYLSNHVSYLDALVLIAVLPVGVTFVGKQELFKSLFLKALMRKLDHVTVERKDVIQSLSDLEVMEAKIKKGKSIMIFPEGTFTHILGLRLFKLGAFKLSVETKTPLCPMAIRGTRQILPDLTYLLRPHPITVTVSDPLYPQGKEWEEVLRLRSLARAEIARNCGEPVYEEG